MCFGADEMNKLFIVSAVICFAIAILVGAVLLFSFKAPLNVDFNVHDVSFNGTHLCFSIWLRQNVSLHGYKLVLPQHNYSVTFTQVQEMNINDNLTFIIPLSGVENKTYTFNFLLYCNEGTIPFKCSLMRSQKRGRVDGFVLYEA